MIVTSLVTQEKYFWVRIPRTATNSYENIFFPERENSNNYYIHSHAPYRQSKDEGFYCDHAVKTQNGFTVVRNPLTRFISGLKYLRQIKNGSGKIYNSQDTFEKYIYMCEYCGFEHEVPYPDPSEEKKMFNFIENETIFYDFIYAHFEKNGFVKTPYTLESAFETSDTKAIGSIFLTQTRYAYHPHVKIFHYEDLSSYNRWIEDTLGYDTSKLPKINATDSINLPIDFSTNKFKELVKYLFYDDFKYFNYDVPI